jgi:hypothetical protein
VIPFSVNLRYLLGILNSKYVSVLLSNLRGGDYHIYPEHLRNLPIPLVSPIKQQPIIALVNQILSAKKENQPAENLEKEIDKAGIWVVWAVGGGNRDNRGAVNYFQTPKVFQFSGKPISFILSKLPPCSII